MSTISTTILEQIKLNTPNDIPVLFSQSGLLASVNIPVEDSDDIVFVRISVHNCKGLKKLSLKGSMSFATT
jgi:hypothetical protein